MITGRKVKKQENIGLTLLNRLITSTHGQMKLDGCRQTGRFALMWSVARPDGMVHTDLG